MLYLLLGVPCLAVVDECQLAALRLDDGTHGSLLVEGG